ncbi:unnamed protein product [Merluccius merluccius]
MGLQLGEEYEKKKQKLQQELRLDYQSFVSKKTDLKSLNPSIHPETLSLLFDERKSVKDKLRDERKKEYNLFLKEQAGLKSASSQAVDTSLRSLATSPVLVPDHQQADDGFHDDQPPPARRDASTLTEEGADDTHSGQRRRRRWEVGRAARETPAAAVVVVGSYERRRPTRRQRRGGRRRRSRAGYSSEEEEQEEEEELMYTDEEEEMEYGGKERPATDAIAMRSSAERARSAANRPRAEVATGLVIGAVEGMEASQVKKELYRLELLEQMAEQRRNKRKEKELEMRVAATGAVDPEKTPDRIAQFREADLRYDSLGRGHPQGDQTKTPVASAAGEKPPPGKPRVAFSFPASLEQHSPALGPPLAARRGVQGSGPFVPLPAPSNEEVRRNLSNALGEMAAPRLADFPPRVPPPVLTDTYRTPYDEAYLYYGARNPLDPNLPYCQYLLRRRSHVPAHGGLQSPTRSPPSGTPSPSWVAASPAALGVLPEERPRQTRESALSYGEALRQQIKESKACRTREREERERYHAKIEEEMKAYEPWGRGGAGAPIRDKGGNLISDLNKMHRTNENAYINSEGGDRTAAEPSQNAAAPPDEDGVPPGQTAHSARGEAFPEEPAPRKVLEQNHYRHFLELQMEEKRSRQAEELEEARREEERAERRMAEDRARMQTEFQQEQEKKRRKGMDQSRSNEELMRQAEERRRRAGRWREEEERERERESEALRQRQERERQESVVQRGPSPLIPTLQRKLGRLPNPGSPPAAGQHTSATLSERSTPAPYSPPVPARRNELRAKEDRQEVIRELSALRRHLSAERHRVERLAQREETHTPPPRPARYRRAPEADVLDVARVQAAQALAGRARSGAARVTMQNIRDFNRLRDRDTASRAEMRYVYPDPPSDELSLDIQQQALLREQQRRTLRTHTHTGLIDTPPRPWRNPNATETLLVSESAFLDHPQGTPPPRRAASQDELVGSPGLEAGGDQSGTLSRVSLASLNMRRIQARNQQRLRRLDHLGLDPDLSSGDVFAMGLQLGEEYEKKKQKLQQELRLDYQSFVSKKTDLKSLNPSIHPETLSLLFDERKSVKDKLRDERKKEYNLFLKEQAGLKSASSQAVDTSLRSLATSPVLVPDHQQADDGFHDDQPPPARRDASTLTEEGADDTHSGQRRRRRWEVGRAARETPAAAVVVVGSYERRRPTRRQRRGGRRRRSRAGYSSEEEEQEEEEELMYTDEEEEMEYGGKERPATDAIAMRSSAERARSAANRPRAEVATGLVIGAVEGMEASQVKKELYRLELLEQMAEQRRNKRKEKELEMRVAATGAVDPEKTPDRIAQFREADLRYDSLGRGHPQGDQTKTPVASAAGEKPPPGKPRVAFSFPASLEQHSPALGPPLAARRGVQGSGPFVPLPAPSNEEVRRNLSNALGEMAAPRLADFPPRVPPPVLTDTYRTPYDEAYLYYGARNPLDPNLPYCQYLLRRRSHVPAHGGLQSPTRSPPSGTPSPSWVAASPAALGVLPEERPRQTRESALSYGEALRQQIKESKACRTREREERERYHAKIEEEMKAYEPWGRGGAGAPIRDKGGNLISDLNKMHRTNENAYINSEGGDRTAAEPSQNAAAPPDEDGVPPGQTAHSARGEAFPEEPAPRKVLEQNHYRHFLELQMEEKRSRQAEELEEARREEERAERRMAEDRARMQTEFQQEQEKKRRKGMDQSRSNEELMRQAEERRRRAGRWREEEERERERESEALRQRQERERQESVVQRGPSPLIPTLQRKLGRLPNPGSPPAAGQHTSATLSERSTPAPYSPPVPARRNELRAKEDRQEVIRELSALRRHLSAERHRVERLAQREETHTPPPRPARYRRAPEADVLDVARVQAAQALAGRARSGAARVTMQNIRDFNRLRDRDTASRAEMRYVYPDPPSDELSLDIQQQALLREQQRRTLRTHTHTGLIDTPPRPWRNPNATETLLVSESAFLDCCSADPSPEPRRTHPPSGEHRGRTTPPSGEHRERTTPPSGEHRGRTTPLSGEHRGRTTPLSGDHRERTTSSQKTPPLSADPTSQRSPPRSAERRGRTTSLSGERNRGSTPPHSADHPQGTPPPRRAASQDTVATELWLRPGTSEAVRRLIRRERASGGGGGEGGTRSQEWLDGPSTYHG